MDHANSGTMHDVEVEGRYIKSALFFQCGSVEIELGSSEANAIPQTHIQSNWFFATVLL